MQFNSNLTHQRLTELLDYDPITGKFIWKVNRPCQMKASEEAGWVNVRGYRFINVDGMAFAAHRLAWLFVTGDWPAEQIDHINRAKADNRIANLREASHGQNRSNAKCNGNNKTGLKGVYPHNGCFQSSVSKDGRRIYLGTFATAEEAHDAYCEAAKELHGEFARTE